MDEQFYTSEVKGMERSLYRVAYSYLRSDEDAADAVQDTLLKGWEKRATLRDEQYFRTWLTRILINACKARLRHRHIELPLIEATASSQDDSHHEFYLRDAMADMDIKYRIPLTLFYLDGFSLIETAQVLGLPKGTVKSRISRAKDQLRNMFKDEEVFEDEAL
ncbi:MAG: RNA polymerase sigma factor [Christensenellales bacterium]